LEALMTARWATTYKLERIYEDPKRDFVFDEDKRYFDDKRDDLGQPIKALIALAKWTREDKKEPGLEKLQTAFKVASSNFNFGGQGRVSTKTLKLDNAALAMAGTTSELEGLLNAMKADGRFNEVLTISAAGNDKLAVAYARIRNKSTAKRETDTVVVIAPVDGWWAKAKDGGINKPEDIYAKDPKAAGWSEFKGATPQNKIKLDDLKTLLKQGSGQKAWIIADDEHFKV
jgi:hypothetical protein